MLRSAQPTPMNRHDRHRQSDPRAPQERQPRRGLRPELRRVRAELVRRGRASSRRRTLAVLPGSLCTARDFLELFESQLVSRHLDLMARVLRVQNKVFYTIGSSGHEGNAMVARLTRHTDPAFLHYRSGAFMAERFRKLPGMDPVMDSALCSPPARTIRPRAGATRCGVPSRCGCCRRPRRSPRTCRRRSAPRSRSSRRGASA